MKTQTVTGQYLNQNTGYTTIVSEIISGTGELANLRGEITVRNNIRSGDVTGTYSGILWFEEDSIEMLE